MISSKPNSIKKIILALTNIKYIVPLIVISNFNVAYASSFPKVDKDISTYDSTVSKMISDFTSIPASPDNKEWVKSKLNNMFETDQYMRSFWNTPFVNQYTEFENLEFKKQFTSRSEDLDARNTSDLKELLKKYEWFKISEFGVQADNQAWIIVQHADHDINFQKIVLPILEKLWPIGETKPANYAYLYDRIASSFVDPTKRVPQKYGTQGRCIKPETWEPWPIQDESNVDQRRRSVGLNTMAEYKAIFKTICH